MNMKKISKKIAKEHGVSVADVKRDIQEAIDAAYADPNFYVKSVQCKGDKPTPEELIEHLAREVSFQVEQSKKK